MRDAEHEILVGRRIAVIGAGPIGLEAALYGLTLGARVRVYERGSVAQSVGEWGHVHLFTPFGMNHSPLGRQALEAAGTSVPGDGVSMTGAEWREAYLLPLAERTPVAGTLELGASVVTVGRGELLKSEHIGNGQRGAAPFRLLIERDDVRELYEEADVLLDCSGSWSNPNWLGQGGVPAVGERESREHIAYHPVDVLGGEREGYAGRRTLLVGDGLSAATTVVALAQLAEQVPGTEAVWATRAGGSSPITLFQDDPLERRVELITAANRVASEPATGVDWLPESSVTTVRWRPDGEDFDVRLAGGGAELAEKFDRVIANVGYSPDNSLYRELQVHECYASGAPMKLAASLLAASTDTGGDCLKLGGLGPDVLVNPEPGFFILGMKSYGRNSAFLLNTGYEQVRDVFSLIAGRPTLDLYAGRERSAGV